MGPVVDASGAVVAAALVEEARASLLRSGSAVTIAGLAAASGRSEDAVRRWAVRYRDVGRLVVVQLGDGTQLVPTFQLDEMFGLDERVAERTQRLVEWGMDPWAVWGWWESLNGWLFNVRSPADAVGADDFDAVDRAINGLIQ